MYSYYIHATGYFWALDSTDLI